MKRMTDPDAFQPYVRDYRPVDEDEKASARRGIEMEKMTSDELLDLRDRHRRINAFASNVIAHAAEDILIERGVL